MNDRVYPFALPIGTEISGYVIDQVIGAGGFGITYRGTNPVTGITVAIKEFYPQGFATREKSTVILHSDVSSGSYETALKKFEQEAAKLTGRYRHPNIVQGLNFLRMNNTAYFVMEFIEGESFDQWLIRHGEPPSEIELKAIFEKIFDAVDYIHGNNGMHRDLTPRNIMIRYDGEPILVDFGAAGEGLDTDRHESTAFAQPNYAPPEQLAADDSRMQGRHTDIFSLGGVLYRSISGRPPAKPLKRSHEMALGGRAADPYVPAAESARAPWLYSSAFFDGVDLALRLDPRDRPPTIGEFRRVLGWTDDETMVVPQRAAVADDPSSEATRMLDFAASVPHATPPTGGSAPPVVLQPDERRAPKRSWGRVIAAALVAVVALGAGAVTLWPKPDPEPVTTISRSDPAAVANRTPAVGQATPAAPAGTPGPTPTVATPSAPPAPTVNWTEFVGFGLTGRESASRRLDGDAFEGCKAQCRDDRSCQAFSVAGDLCRSYAAVEPAQPEPGTRLAIRSTAAGLTGVRAAIDTEARRRPTFRTLDSITLVAAGQPRTAANQAQCAFACLSDQSCKAWTYMALANACRTIAEVDPATAGPGVGFVTGIEDPDGRIGEAMRRTVSAKTRTAQAFIGAELVGQSAGRDRAVDGNACRANCLANQACIAAVQAEGECQQFSRVDDIRKRADAEVFVDVRQSALVSRVDGVVKDKAADAGRGQADFFPGFDIVGTAMSSDRARAATTMEACQSACGEAATCQAFSFSTAENRCQILSAAQDVVPDNARLSGIYRGLAGVVADAARRRLVASEQGRGNYRDLPADCAPAGTRMPTQLASQPSAEQCAFLCRSGAGCQGWSFSAPDRACHIYSAVTGGTAQAGITAGLFDPTGRRVADVGRSCTPASAATLAPNAPTPTGPIPPNTIAQAAPGAAECDRLAGYVYDPDLPRGVAARQYEHIDPSRAIPACLAVLATAPATSRWRLALGRAYERDGREADARAAYREAAEGGSGAAAFLYGIMLDKGQGGPEDDVEAERYFKLARSRGVAPAGTALALLYSYSDRATTTNDQEIIDLLQEAANRGHAPAMYRLGELYEKGRLNRRFLPFDPNQSFAWYAKAFAIFSREAGQRDPTALRFLSLQYDGGRGVPRDVGQAVRTLQQYLSIAYGPDNLVIRRRGSIGDVTLDEWTLDTRKAFQQFLAQVGGFDDTVDGIIGGRSREAMERWLGLRS